MLDEQSQALQQDSSGVAVGKLLRADVIGVLETTPDGKEAGGFAVLDTAAGVSYWNQGLESSGVEEVAREIVRGVTAALEKHGRAGSLSTVCMLGARNAEFPRNMDVFCEMVAYLLGPAAGGESCRDDAGPAPAGNGDFRKPAAGGGGQERRVIAILAFGGAGLPARGLGRRNQGLGACDGCGRGFDCATGGDGPEGCGRAGGEVAGRAG